MRFVDIHLLQSLPPSNVNRDDANAPKDAIFGGVRRARVSSQSWKRATRLAFAEQGMDEDLLAVRTKRLIAEIAATITGPDSTELETADATTVARKVTNALELKAKNEDLGAFLVFIGRDEIERIADVAREHQAALLVGEPGKVLPKKVLDGLLTNTTGAVDLALFGRMVATRPEVNIDGAASVAHALSTHKVEQESDFYTALDDLLGADKTGADMMGSVEFNAAVFYRYASIDVDQLRTNLRGDRARVEQAARAFLTCFTASMPSGKQRTFAAYTPVSVLLLTARPDQPVNLANAFEQPVSVRGESTLRGYLNGSAAALAAHWQEIQNLLGAPPSATSFLGLAALDSLTKQLEPISSSSACVKGPIPEVIGRAVAAVAGT